MTNKKLNSLEGKIRQILNDKLFEYGVPGFPHIAYSMAHDIAEICEVERDTLRDSLGEMLKENTELKLDLTIKAEYIEELKDDNLRLKDEVNKLDEGIHHHKDPHFKMFQEIQIHLEQEIEDFKILLADKDKQLDKLMNDTTECEACLDLCFKNEKLTK